jgi:hypothetical protein
MNTIGKSGIYLDSKEFDANFEKLVHSVVPELARNGLYDAMQELLTDADNEAPQTPYLDGALRASRKIEKIAVSEGKIEVQGGYNSEYATYQHEGQRKDGSHIVEHYTRTAVLQPGPKFIESKMVRWRNKYMKTCVDYIKKNLEAKARA